MPVSWPVHSSSRAAHLLGSCEKIDRALTSPMPCDLSTCWIFSSSMPFQAISCSCSELSAIREMKVLGKGLGLRACQSTNNFGSLLGHKVKAA